MKKLTHCPYCHSPIGKNSDFKSSKYELCKNRCQVDYFQFLNNLWDEEVEYVYLHTPNRIFSIYWYLNSNVYPVKFIQVYSVVELSKQGVAWPCLTAKNFELDLHNLQRMEEKFKNYLVFS